MLNNPVGGQLSLPTEHPKYQSNTFLWIIQIHLSNKLSLTKESRFFSTRGIKPKLMKWFNLTGTSNVNVSNRFYELQLATTDPDPGLHGLLIPFLGVGWILWAILLTLAVAIKFWQKHSNHAEVSIQLF